MRPICIPCQRFFKCVKTGFHFTEGMPKETGVKPGKTERHRWLPYKLWSGDRYQCPSCGAEIIAGFGREPIRVQHEKDFAEMQESLEADKFQVNDC